ALAAPARAFAGAPRARPRPALAAAPRARAAGAVRAAAPAAHAAELGRHGLDLLAGRLEAQRAVGDLDRVGDLREHERDVGSHARPQRLVGVVDVDHRVVGHDALGRGRRVADLADLAVELAAGERVDGERRLHALDEPADIA